MDSYKRTNCSYCDSSIIKKNRKSLKDEQRYICLNEQCGKSFSSVTNSFLIGTKKLKRIKCQKSLMRQKWAVVGHRELLCIQTVIDDTKRPIFKIHCVSKASKITR